MLTIRLRDTNSDDIGCGDSVGGLRLIRFLTIFSNVSEKGKN